ncbi:MAG TPA: 2-hydroxyacid dehydrogenase [Treponemataceae bacterium]|nr:2-hydroxyacid dehydrogenase [Treponemataceae bacterium]
MSKNNFSIAFYDTRPYDRDAFTRANKKFLYNIDFFDFHLNEKTAQTAKGYKVVCAFVNDILNKVAIKTLADCGVELIAMRCAGFNNVDVQAAKAHNIEVVRVPAYSPHSVAEHAAALLLALTRKIPQAYLRTRSGNFTLNGLTGRDLYRLTAGIIGTGRIGRVMADILAGFGMKIVLSDVYPNKEWAKEKGYAYVPLEEFFKRADVISLHCPLTEQTKHIINAKSLALMKKDAVIINTGRGALIDSTALVHALKNDRIGGAALDVYEEESKYFFEDWSINVIRDDVLSRLMTFPNVIITAHQAFLTTNALSAIAHTSLCNVRDFMKGNKLKNKVVLEA